MFELDFEKLILCVSYNKYIKMSFITPSMTPTFSSTPSELSEVKYVSPSNLPFPSSTDVSSSTVSLSVISTVVTFLSLCVVINVLCIYLDKRTRLRHRERIAEENMQMQIQMQMQMQTEMQVVVHDNPLNQVYRVYV